MEGATPQWGGELVRTCGRTSYSPPVPHQRPKKGGRSLHLRWPRTGTAGARAGPKPQASQPHKEAPPRTSKRLFGAPTPHCLMCACGPARDRCCAARFPVQLPGLGGGGDGREVHGGVGRIRGGHGVGATATGTITDNDELPGLTIEDAAAVSEGNTAEFLVQLSKASGRLVTVSYRTVDWAA